MPKITYTLVQRDPNSWTVDPELGNIHTIVASCDHKHRNLSTAIACADQIGINCPLGRLGRIEKSTGERVDLDG